MSGPTIKTFRLMIFALLGAVLSDVALSMPPPLNHVCLARNGLGRVFSGTDVSQAQARAKALAECQGVSAVCYATRCDVALPGDTFVEGDSWVTGYLADGGDIRDVTGLETPSVITGVWDDIQPTATLPTRFDWRDVARLQAVRDQRSCGSCWSFSILGVLEALHRLIHPELFPEIDLAEQTLVSSCERGGSCAGGYFSAFDYTRDEGVPVEADDPYQARNTTCKPGLRPFLKTTRWAYIGPENGTPSVEQLKQAIYDHGPISVDVNGSFSSYSSGVYNRCGGTSTNHMVVIVAFVDDQDYAANGGGYWIMRNSWSSDWGEEGYMKIAYKDLRGRPCNGIGGVGAYAVIDGVENIREYLGIGDAEGRE